MALALVVILGVSLVVFVTIRLSGDPVALLLPPDASRQDYAKLRRALGLDRPVLLQYTLFLAHLVRGDFGISFRSRRPAIALVIERLPASAKLTLSTFVLVLAIAIPLGILSAVRRGSFFDHLVSVATLAGQSMPNYWSAIILILVFAVDLRWVPTSGYGSIRHLILPTVALAFQPASRSARLVRSEMLEILGQDYIRTAKAKGLTELRVLLVHSLRNASIPLVTLLGLDVGYLLGGAIVVETVFSWPGAGRLLIDAVSQRDFPVVQATVVMISVTVVVVNLLVDVSYVLLDPRIRLR